MTDQERNAMEMALEALENVYGKGKRCEAAITVLRQALAQPDDIQAAVLAERDACAKVCEGRLQEGLNFEGCAAAIRARGDKYEQAHTG